MNSLFIRIYWGMLVAALVMVSIVFVTFSHVNALRQQEFRNKHISVLLDLAEAQFKDRPSDQFFIWVGEVSRRLNGQLRMVTDDKLMLPPGATQNLRTTGRLVLFDAAREEVNAYLKVPGDEFYVRFILAESTREYLPNLADIIFDFFESEQFASLSSATGSLAQSIGLKTLSSTAVHLEDNMGQLQRAYLERGYVVALEYHQLGSYLQSAFDNQPGLYFVRQSGANIIAWGPVIPFNPYPVWLILLFGSISTAFIGCIGYFLVRPLETGMKQMEAAIEQIRRGNLSARVYIDTNDAIGDLATTINGMAEHIQRLIKSQREMTNAVSHELRTPVARIRFGLQIIQDFVDLPSVDDQVDKIDGDIVELEKLIDEILTYATLEEGRPALDLEEVDINKIAQEVKNQSLASGHNIKISVLEVPEESGLYLAECERRYIHRAVQNLVNNAVKYAASEVRVTCSSEGGMFRIDVEDDGPGIPQDQWEHVFTPFARLDSSRNRSTGGYGLGLSIVRSIAYWHGGVAAVYFGDLGGAKFTILWPRTQTLRKALAIDESTRK